MRLFVGLSIPDAIRERMRAYVGGLKARGAQAKWTNPDGWHVTLKFIGNTSRDAEIRSALSVISAPPFQVSFHGVGFFTPRQPRIFYAGIEASPQLAELAARINRALVSCGVAAEEKKYSPHLTLARTGSGNPHMTKGDRARPTMDALKRMVETSPDWPSIDFGTMTASEFILYLSELSPKGARYTVLQRFPLGR